MSGYSNDRLLAEAIRLLDLGQLDHAVDLFCQVLGRDPDNAEAHAFLAVALIDQNRLYAGEQEAQIALSLAPDLAVCHFAAGMAELFQLRFRKARGHFDEALALEPETPYLINGRTRVALFEDNWDDVQRYCERTLAIEPVNVPALTWLSAALLRRDETQEAEAVIRQALHAEPEDPEALVQMGYLLLDRGEVEEAAEHALLVLTREATHLHALALYAAVRARRGRLLGLWWRLNAWLVKRGPMAQTGILLGLYVAVQFAGVALRQAGMPLMADVLWGTWLVICVYSWVGPAIFNHLLEKELTKVKLQPGF
jgi:tetratricopeptide (TPR) repeat protein